MIASILALAAAAGGQAEASGYRPVRCEARRAYAGAPLHPAMSPALPAPLVEAPLPPADAARLDAAFATAQERTRAEALTVAVARLGEGMWARSALPAPAERLWWASAGKAFIATVVLQLADEGRLSLDDPIARWVADVPNANAITIRDLLQHTSGLFSANEDLAWRADPGPMTAAQHVAILRRHGAIFCPGERWRYSNSGYALLGRVIEAIEGRSWQEAIEARIVRPLNLASVRVLRPGQPAGVAPLRSEQRPLVDPSWPGPAGAIAAEAGDMVRFWAALLEGRLVRPATRDAMFSALFPMFDPGSYYGLGVMVYDVPDGAGRLILFAHAGGAPGASAMIAYSPRDRTIAVAALNADASAAAVVNLMLRSLRAGREEAQR